MSSGFVKVCEGPLNLMEEVIINMIPFGVKGPFGGFLIIGPQEQVPEGLIDIKLLDHGVHVANIA